MNVNLLELDLSSNANIKARDFKRKVSYHKTKVAEKKESNESITSYVSL